MKFEYLNLLVLICFSFVLPIIILMASYFLIPQGADLEKGSAYECGFYPFEDTRNPFDVHFYVVSILFIIFDLEISYLFPWCTTLSQQGIEGFGMMFLFLVILTVGFVYEWFKGALEFSTVKGN